MKQTAIFAFVAWALLAAFLLGVHSGLTQSEVSLHNNEIHLQWGGKVFIHRIGDETNE